MLAARDGIARIIGAWVVVVAVDRRVAAGAIGFAIEGAGILIVAIKNFGAHAVDVDMGGHFGPIDQYAGIVGSQGPWNLDSQGVRGFAHLDIKQAIAPVGAQLGEMGLPGDVDQGSEDLAVAGLPGQVNDALNVSQGRLGLCVGSGAGCKQRAECQPYMNEAFSWYICVHYVSPNVRTNWRS